MYAIERYSELKRFNKQYEEIYHFLLKAADHGYGNT